VNSVELPQVTVDNFPATVLFSGLAPGEIGVWQVNVKLSAALQAGEHIVELSVAGAQQPVSFTVTVAQ